MRARRRDASLVGLAVALVGGGVALGGLLASGYAAIACVLVGVAVFAIGCMVIGASPP
jgi:hypothetical protein